MEYLHFGHCSERLDSVLSDTDSDDFSCFHHAKGVAHLRHERTELLHAIRASNCDNDCDTGREHVLLKSKILIDGEERFKTLGEHELQEVAIAL